MALCVDWTEAQSSSKNVIFDNSTNKLISFLDWIENKAVTAMEESPLRQSNQEMQDLITAQHLRLAQVHEALREELKIGARIHEVLLKGRTPQAIGGYDIAATTIPSRDIDGDFYDFYHPRDTLVDIVIGDVMGKGLPAALIGTAIKTQLHRFAVPMSFSHSGGPYGFWKSDIPSPEEILTKVHHEICNQLIDLGYFTSLFYARFDWQRRCLTYVDCGSTKPLHIQSSEDCSKWLEGKNFPLGMVDATEYESLTVPYKQGDLFIFYSDGITEARAPDDSLFGLDRLCHIVRDNKEKTPSELLTMIKDSVLSFSGKQYFDDDLTLIIIKITDEKPSSFAPEKTATYTSDLCQLPVVRQFIENVCLDVPGDAEQLCSQLQLAINEVFCNIVKHGYEGRPGGDIVIETRFLDEGIAIEISDQGKAFNPSVMQGPRLAGDGECGLGLYIIGTIADRLTYIPKDTEKGWNRLRLFKRYCNAEKDMVCSHDMQNNVMVVTVNREYLDAKEAPSFKNMVIELIGNNDCSNIVLDLNKLQFIDSSGLGSFLSILRFLHSRQGDLKIANMTKPIRATFEIVRMHKLFEIFNSTDEAVRSFDL